MSTYNDRRMEASAVKRGAPLGPRMLPVISYDDDGMLTTYTGKLCRVCACQLTSRNRYGDSTLCTEHGREAERSRVRTPATTGAKQSRAATAQAHRDPCPHRLAVHRALSWFLERPMDEVVYTHALAAMRDYELRARLLNAIPRGADDSAPVPPQHYGA